MSDRDRVTVREAMSRHIPRPTAAEVRQCRARYNWECFYIGVKHKFLFQEHVYICIYLTDKLNGWSIDPRYYTNDCLQQ